MRDRNRLERERLRVLLDKSRISPADVQAGCGVPNSAIHQLNSRAHLSAENFRRVVAWLESRGIDTSPVFAPLDDASGDDVDVILEREKIPLLAHQLRQLADSISDSSLSLQDKGELIGLFVRQVKKFIKARDAVKNLGKQ